MITYETTADRRDAYIGWLEDAAENLEREKREFIKNCKCDRCGDAVEYFTWIEDNEMFCEECAPLDAREVSLKLAFYLLG